MVYLWNSDPFDFSIIVCVYNVEPKVKKEIDLTVCNCISIACSRNWIDKRSHRDQPWWNFDSIRRSDNLISASMDIQPDHSIYRDTMIGSSKLIIVRYLIISNETFTGSNWFNSFFFFRMLHIYAKYLYPTPIPLYFIILQRFNNYRYDKARMLHWLTTQNMLQKDHHIHKHWEATTTTTTKMTATTTTAISTTTTTIISILFFRRNIWNFEINLRLTMFIVLHSFDLFGDLSNYTFLETTEYNKSKNQCLHFPRFMYGGHIGFPKMNTSR